MNAVEIEEAITALAAEPFDAANFGYAFLEAFGNKATTIKRLKSGGTNKSDLGGVLQRSNIHIAPAQRGEVSAMLDALRESKATKTGKVQFILSTDGADFEAEDLDSGDTIACAFADFPDHFGFFLPLAGISTVKAIRESAFDIKATGRLNRLYVELLKDNPQWGKAERRAEMNSFMARLIFCFFAEDTDIFNGEGLFTKTIEQMSQSDSANTHEVMEKLFIAMNTATDKRGEANLPRWADAFPYVNGGLFSGKTEVPRFSKISRSYLLHIGKLDWQKINPDIFGSMIQAISDDDERHSLGMHYTSVPNILKVLNPLFLDELRQKLEEAGDNKRTLLNLKNRLAKIRVFDPACGSGNFLVIAYKQLREIEAQINERRGERDAKTVIPLTNFRGIELRQFPAEIARLALIIAEYQCDVAYRGQKEALAELLPLNAMNWIICGNALQLDWLNICPPTGTGVKITSDDLFGTPLNQTEIDFENEGGETYICGNPPYIGSTWQSKEQKADLEKLFNKRTKLWKSLDYVAGWFMKATDYSQHSPCSAAFVTTNSICQGQQVAILWPLVFAAGVKIHFAHTSFKWANLASHNAGVTVAIVGITNQAITEHRLYEAGSGEDSIQKSTRNINPYLIFGENTIVEKISKPLTEVTPMDFGSKPVDGGHLFFTETERLQAIAEDSEIEYFIKPFSNSEEFINGKLRYCLWIEEDEVELATAITEVKNRLEKVSAMRAASTKKQTQELAEKPYQFGEPRHQNSSSIIAMPRVSSESRAYLPVGLLTGGSVVGDANFALFDAPLWNLAFIASRIHLVWIATVCGKLKTDFRYSNTMGWNTFPVPKLTEKNKADLTRCAEAILLAREAHFPATIADLYKPGAMPQNLRDAHDQNDEVIERIYLGRRFKNDTERLEKLFELYTRLTATKGK